jgi:hypothetical protein
MAFIDAKRKALVWLGRYRGLYRGDVCHYFGGQTGMTTPDIAGLCERLDILHEWQDSPRDRETITLSKSTLERQAAEIERLREALTMTKGPLGSTGPTPVYEAVLAALTGEDTATLGLSGKTQTDARTRGDG